MGERESPYAAKVMGKDNVLPLMIEVYGDIRFLSEQILKDTREKMKTVIAEELTKIKAEYETSAQVAANITFGDRFPAMEETTGNLALLAMLSTASSDLGFGPLVHFTEHGGAAHASFVAPYVKGVVDGLGPLTVGMHSKDEVIDLASIKVVAKRAAVLMLRLQKNAPIRR